MSDVIKASSIEHNLYQYLSTTGVDPVSVAESNLSVDGSGPGGVEFYIQPPEDQTFIIQRVMILVQDGGTWQVQKFGGLAALNNGVVLKAFRGDDTLIDYTGVYPIKTNGDWASLCYDVRFDTYGSGESYLHSRWTFGLSGSPLLLSGRRKEKFVCTVQDDISDLTTMRLQMQGFREGNVS